MCGALLPWISLILRHCAKPPCNPSNKAAYAQASIRLTYLSERRSMETSSGGKEDSGFDTLIPRCCLSFLLGMKVMEIKG